jgi:serine/threonine-protein kinase
MYTNDNIESGDVFDGFQILQVLTRSGMGSVYRAKKMSNGCEVVIKLPHLAFESDPGLYARFEREERIGLRLDHPAVVKTLPVTDKSRPYIVTEYVEGRSLWEIMKVEGRQPVSRVLDVARQLCDALAYLHHQGVVHRDLKPQNIILDSAGGVHLIDFGIALDRESPRITWGGFSALLGTPEYMAPEQILGKRGDGRTDVYALGTILYEMLSGSLPYSSHDQAALMRLKSRQSPRHLKEVAEHLDPALADALMHAIAREPGKRYPDVGRMLDVLTNPSKGFAWEKPTPKARKSFAAQIGPRFMQFFVLGAALVGAFLAAVHH